MIKAMEKVLRITTLKYQVLKDMIDATGINSECLCTYCWTGKEIP
jgi:amidophosphoribosyltransferase